VIKDEREQRLSGVSQTSGHFSIRIRCQVHYGLDIQGAFNWPDVFVKNEVVTQGANYSNDESEDQSDDPNGAAAHHRHDSTTGRPYVKV
jgi:hypothetical protein